MAHQEGCSDGGDEADADGDGGEGGGDEAGGDAELGDDEGEFADGSEGETGLEGGAVWVSGGDEADGAGDGADDESKSGGGEDEGPGIEEDAGINEHADGYEEDGAESVAEGFEAFLDFGSEGGAGDDGPEDEGAEGEGIADASGEPGEGQDEGDEEQGAEFDGILSVEPAEHPWDDEEGEEEDEDDEGAEFAEGGADGRGGGAAEAGDGGEDGEHDDGDDVFEDGDAEGELTPAFVGGVQFFEDLGDDGGAGDHEHAGEEQGLLWGPAEGASEEAAAIEDEQGADRGGEDEGQSEALKSTEAQTHADGEDQEDEAEVGEHLDPFDAFDQGERRGVGPDDDPGEEVTDDHGEAQPSAEPAGEGGHGGDDGEVTDEFDSRHGPERDEEWGGCREGNVRRIGWEHSDTALARGPAGRSRTVGGGPQSAFSLPRSSGDRTSPLQSGVSSPQSRSV